MLKYIIFVAWILVSQSLPFHHDLFAQEQLVPVADDALNVPENLRGLVDSIARLEYNDRGYCTGAFLGGNRVLTAAHCVWSWVQDYSYCPGMQVRWGVRESALSISDCQSIEWISPTIGGIDIAIFTINNPPNVSPIDPAPDLNLQRGQEVTIFSHPRGRPLEWSGFCEMELIGPGLDYGCQTEIGSSGAPIIDVQTLKIIGVHTRPGGGVHFQRNGIPF